MSIDKFNSRILEIEAKHRDVFKGRRIFSYFALDQDRSTENYIINIDPNKVLPQSVRNQIQEAYNLLLSK
jgi:hypothetical protein